MRVFKFRIWNKIAKRFIDNQLANSIFFKLFEYPEYEITQYTGVKDCDGVEIFEGDILEIYTKDLDLKERYEVVWSPNYLCFYLNDNKSIAFFDWNELTGSGSYARVVSNRYEE